jgi:TonB family protein
MRPYHLTPWQLSFLLHFLVAASLVMLTRLPSPAPEMIEIPITFKEPEAVQNLAEVKEEKPKVVLKSVNEPAPTEGPSRQVFGTSRNAHTDDSTRNRDGIDAKQGNTLAKEVDEQELTDQDVDALPVPTEEYLVSEMPSVLAEVRPQYPREAREQRLEGAIVLDILIDSQGQVREAKVVEGPAVFRAGALAAIKQFKFRPARVEGNPVAVRIRYTLRFQLEY